MCICNIACKRKNTESNRSNLYESVIIREQILQNLIEIKKKQKKNR